MSKQDPSESLKQELLDDCNPYPVDDVYLKMIEDGEVELTNDRLFDLIKESPAWLGTTPIQKRIAQWQYILGNDLFDDEEWEEAKKNLERISRVMVYQGQGRPRELSGPELYRMYAIIESRISLFLKENNIEPSQRLKAVRDHFPDYNIVIQSGTPQHRTSKAIARYVLEGYAGIGKSKIYEAIGKHSKRK